MSLIAAALTKEIFYITTDTLVSRTDVDGKRPNEPILVNLQSKIDYYPHLSCCVVGLGCSDFTLKHNQFVQTSFCTDVADLYELTAKHFAESIDKSAYKDREDGMIGVLNIFGFSKKKNKMVAYKIDVRRDKPVDATEYEIVEESEGLRTVMSPRLNPETEEKIFDGVFSRGGDIKDVLIEVAKEMHAGSVTGAHEITTGGELHFTIIGMHEGNFFCNFQTVHRFFDYDRNVSSIKKYYWSLHKNGDSGINLLYPNA